MRCNTESNKRTEALSATRRTRGPTGPPFHKRIMEAIVFLATKLRRRHSSYACVYYNRRAIRRPPVRIAYVRDWLLQVPNLHDLCKLDDRNGDDLPSFLRAIQTALLHLEDHLRWALCAIVKFSNMRVWEVLPIGQGLDHCVPEHFPPPPAKMESDGAIPDVCGLGRPGRLHGLEIAAELPEEEALRHVFGQLARDIAVVHLVEVVLRHGKLDALLV